MGRSSERLSRAAAMRPWFSRSLVAPWKRWDFALESPFDAFWDLFCSVSNARYAAMIGDKGDLLTDYGRNSIEYGATVTGPDYARALGKRAELMMAFGKLLDEYDLLLSPTVSAGAFPVGEPPSVIDGRDVDTFSGFFPFTYPIKHGGAIRPASIPCGFTSEDLPVGLHIVGRWGDEETVIAASAAFEEARPWAHIRPPVLVGASTSQDPFGPSVEDGRRIQMADSPDTRPNVLVFICDQLRPDLLGCYGGDLVRTPNIDALAADSTVFRERLLPRRPSAPLPAPVS